jgi:2-keto-4-pentenoate hydratase/2-oxohepta-3-ene-1,7-dioic acid hydratase in catechol pathway
VLLLVGASAAEPAPAAARFLRFQKGETVAYGLLEGDRVRELSGDLLGVTCGNDVSERIWQNDEQRKDIQWWRAKGSDTFGPVGPYVATGLDCGNLELRLRVNGELKQQDRTSHLIHDVAAIVSGISPYVTLQPGDLIFTGTPGTTSALKPGDVVEVQIEGIGVGRNPVVAAETGPGPGQ